MSHFHRYRVDGVFFMVVFQETSVYIVHMNCTLIDWH